MFPVVLLLACHYLEQTNHVGSLYGHHIVLVALFVVRMSSLEFVGPVLAVSGCMHEFPVVQSYCSIELMLFDVYRVGDTLFIPPVAFKCVNSCICMFIQCAVCVSMMQCVCIDGTGCVCAVLVSCSVISCVVLVYEV